ncbi:MAG TPA: GAF domain-containing sensor histidine kinase [Thermoflexia bacterium]|nr:GAF domain-containing sensor histidine kinase [Thermoflexia bacterium]
MNSSEVSVLRQRINTLEQILAISRQLNSTLEMRPLLLRIVESARDMTAAGAASILLVESENTLRFAAFCGPKISVLKSAAVPINKSLAGWVVQQKQTAIVNDAESDPRMYDLQPHSTVRSIIAVPLSFGSQIIGVLEVLTHQQTHHFTPSDVETLETLASIAAVAVQNARLFQQNDWIAEIVHEIRTPLTSILAYADLLERPQLNRELGQQFIQIIQQEAERVGTLINQFLDLAQLESGRVTMEEKILSFPAIITHAANVLRPRAAQRDMQINQLCPHELPRVTGDAQRIEQVLLNFLSNAVKYANPHTTIDLVCQEKDGEVIVSVTDHGAGISAEHLALLFQKFSRLPGSEKHATGSGLGLHISRQIIAAHHGRIWATSALGQGSTFAFALPSRTNSVPEQP